MTPTSIKSPCFNLKGEYKTIKCKLKETDADLQKTSCKENPNL